MIIIKYICTDIINHILIESRLYKTIFQNIICYEARVKRTELIIRTKL